MELDGGPVILQASVPVLENDNAEILAKRVLEKEHIIYPKCVQWLCENKVYYKEGYAYFDGEKLEEPLQL
jgi:phosphoribosylglycinamide formyltransferase-1